MQLLKITKKMTGKLEGISSINTDPFTNSFCMKMSESKDVVCSMCYSQKMLKSYRKKCRKPWNENGEVLSAGVIPENLLPKINKDVFRFSAHGEIINEAMYINYLNIMHKNPDTIFAIWTKRNDIIKKIGRGGRQNMILVYSSPKINERKPKVPKYFDKVFTVYTPEFAAANGIDINCGKKKCIECMLCYSDNDITHVNEIVKDKQHIWKHMQEG